MASKLFRAKSKKNKVYHPGDVRDIGQEVEGLRSEVEIVSEQTSYDQSSQNMIHFKLPTQGNIDYRRGLLLFQLSITNSNAAATYTRLAQGAWSPINEVVLENKGTSIERGKEFSYLMSIYNELLSTRISQDTVGNALYGIGTAAERNSWASSAKWYAIPIPFKIFQQHIIPHGMTQLWEMKLYINSNPSQYIESDGGTNSGHLTITISNPKLLVEKVEQVPQWEGQMRSLLTSEEGLVVPFFDFEHRREHHQSNQLAFKIDHQSTSTDHILVFQRDNTTLGSTANNDKYLLWNKFDLKSMQIQRGTSYFPQEPIDLDEFDNIRAYITALKWIEKHQPTYHHDMEPPEALTISNFLNYRFFSLVDFEAHPGTKLMNNFGSRSSDDKMTLNLLYTSVPANQLRVDLFIGHWKKARITPRGVSIFT